jgi:hypothetical protein
LRLRANIAKCSLSWIGSPDERMPPTSAAIAATSWPVVEESAFSDIATLA